MSINILLITPLNVPFQITHDWWKGNPHNQDKSYIKRKLDPKYPVGNLCIGAYLKDKIPYVNVNILDYNTSALRYFDNHRENTNEEDFLNFGLELLNAKANTKFVPDIVGISALFSSNYYDMGTLIDYIKRKFPQSMIIAGGHLASACYREFLGSYQNLKAINYGEGEIPVLNLTKAYLEGKTGEYLEKDSSWITRNKLQDPKFNPVNTLIENLDEVPPYQLEMVLHPDDYFNTNDDVFTLGTDTKKSGERDIAMFATRGCPYHCIFCSSQLVHGHKIRKYSTERIKKDIIYYNDKYGITSFPFLDDHFLASKKNALEILDFIYQKGFSSRIFNLSYLHIDREIIRALKKTGSDRALITIDGLNENFLKKVIKKPTRFEKAKEVIQAFKEEGIIIINNNIIGFPGETPEDIDRGVNTMLDMGANWYAILTAIPLHGSKLYDICKANGYIPDNDTVFSSDFHSSVIETPEFTTEWIKKKAYEINLTLNFVHNYDMHHGKYAVPLSLYERIITKVLDTHAFAYYYAAVCAKELGDLEKYKNYRTKYYQMIDQHTCWKEWADYFKLQDIESIQ